MKIFTNAQIRELDKYTIEHEPIKSIDLMERAAKALTHAIAGRWMPTVPVVVFAGRGNNGGDALAVARLLTEMGYQVQTYLFNIGGPMSADCTENKRRLLEVKKAKNLFTEVTQEFDPPHLERGMLVVDGLFGSGLNKPLSGGFASLVKYINSSKAEVVSIDVPSGLMTEDNTYNVRQNIVRATLTLTLGQKKLSMLFAENQPFIGELQVLDIGLSPEGTEKTDSQYTMLAMEDVKPLLLPCDPFAHKGSMGHALIIAGSFGMAGAAILATEACLRSGAGKVTAYSPRKNVPVLQTAVPEAVLHVGNEETAFVEAFDTEDFQAVGIGPGLGTDEATAFAVHDQLLNARRLDIPTVIDADALNILAMYPQWWNDIPGRTVITPHAGEYARLEKAGVDLRRVTLVSKGHNTTITSTGKTSYVCPWGNSGMATAGSGDVLTGMILGFLAQGYGTTEAAILGVSFHAIAGDRAASVLGEHSMIASDIVDNIRIE